jgi:CheY-like chemotaxis protein
MSKQILLCDDEIHILRAAEMKARRSGYDVRIARDGQEAWEMIQRERPDLVVTDVQMPRMDGLELTRRIRSDASLRELPIVMLTAKGFELDPSEILGKWGVSEVLSKPFSPRELVRHIDQILGAAPATTH